MEWKFRITFTFLQGGPMAAAPRNGSQEVFSGSKVDDHYKIKQKVNFLLENLAKFCKKNFRFLQKFPKKYKNFIFNFALLQGVLERQPPKLTKFLRAKNIFSLENQTKIELDWSILKTKLMKILMENCNYMYMYYL